MQFASYPAFRTTVQQLIDGDDISQSSISVAILDMMISIGERDIYRKVRSSTMDTTFSQTVTSNVMALPTGFLEFKSGPFVAANKLAVFMPYELLANKIQVGAQNSTSPCYYGFQGDTVVFYPTQDGITATGQYYQKFADIQGGTLNSFFTRHPDLFLYAALAMSAPYVGEKDRLPIWQDTYEQLIVAVNEEERRRITRGSKLQTRIG